MKYFFGSEYLTQDDLDEDCGRALIYQDKIMVSKINSMNFPQMLQSFSMKHNFNIPAAFENAIRLYFINEGDRVIVSPAREEDEEMFYKNKKLNAKLVKQRIR